MRKLNLSVRATAMKLERQVRPKKVIMVLTCATLALIGLAGCTSMSEPAPAIQKHALDQGPKLTLSKAREYQNSELVTFVSFVHEASIVDDHGGPVPESSALSCEMQSEPGESAQQEGIMLPGRYAVDVLPDSDIEAMLDEVWSEYAKKPLWSVKESDNTSQNADGTIDESLELEFISPLGFKFFIDYYPVDGDLIRISVASFSPCFEAPQDFDPFEDY